MPEKLNCIIDSYVNEIDSEKRLSSVGKVDVMASIIKGFHSYLITSDQVEHSILIPSVDSTLSIGNSIS